MILICTVIVAILGASVILLGGYGVILDIALVGALMNLD